MGDKYSGYEYIKRQDAFAAARKIGQKAYEKLDTSGAVAAMMITDELRAIPPVDVAPVRHGRYIGEYNGYADGSPVYDMWYCSECGCYFEEWGEKPTYNYCPNCGAKMGGAE